MSFIKRLFCIGYKFADGIGRDLSLLLVRISMIWIFFRSGMIKIGDWENTLFLFELEYAVPILPHVWSAYAATFIELTMPVLILVGLCTRLASLPLLGMAMVIQFVLGAANPAYNQLAHYLWMILLLMLVSHGAGRISLDWVLCKIFCRGGKSKKSSTEEPLDLV